MFARRNIVNGAALVMMLVLLCIGCFALYRAVYPLAQGPDDSAEYLVNLSALLGPNWQTGSSYHLEPLRADLRGFDRRIIGHTCLNTWHKNAPLAFVKQCVFVYQDTAFARERYTQQKSLYDSETVGNDPPYTSVPLPPGQTLGADDRHLACVEAATNQFCVALLRYGDHVVFVNSVLVRDGVTYLSEDVFFDIVQTIDRSIQGLRDISHQGDVL